jgi:hypothetical protein
MYKLLKINSNYAIFQETIMNLKNTLLESIKS